LPLSYRLYLPEEWTEDKARRKGAGVPKQIAFATKGEMARTQIEAALAAGVPRGPVLIDAGYGDEAALRDWLRARELVYAAGIRPATAVWYDEYQPAPAPVQPGRGRPRTRVMCDETHTPISVKALAEALPPSRYRTLTWRAGTQTSLRSRFARVRVRAAHANRPRPEEWLLIEWPKGQAEPTRYFLSTLPEDISFKALVATVKMRWRIERDYRELKQEVGLGHYEGRNWRGFHHHASLCIAAYGFLMLERLSGVKKNTARLKTLALPEGFRPRGAVPDAAARSVVHLNGTLSSRTRHRSQSSALSVLREVIYTEI
jgi:SRSO17 transposase